MIELLPQYRDAVIKNGRSWYEIDGVKHVRVTTSLNVINKPALVPWAIKTTTEKFRSVLEANINARISAEGIDDVLAAVKSAADESRDEAAARGNAIHAAIYDWETVGDRPADLVINQAIQAYDNWRATAPMEVVASEITVWSPSDQYAGTIDQVCRNSAGHWSVIDFKTGGAYPEAALQVAAYANALEELTGIPVDDAWILRIPRDQPLDGSPQFFTKYMTSDHIQSNFEAFRNALYLQRTLKNGVLWVE
tara:strand:- start:3061 stop:3813 length:753 start_codon:yes stop_codon:yes gene_type:complete